jgi:hypothetical protein
MCESSGRLLSAIARAPVCVAADEDASVLEEALAGKSRTVRRRIR